MKNHNATAQTAALNYKMIPVAELTANPRNARTHSPAQIKKIAASIKRFNFLAPMVITNENVIIAGHGRLDAAKTLGLEQVPCIIADHLSEAEIRAYMLADNRIQLDSGWDESLLKIELSELMDMDFDLDVTGFDADEVDEILGIDKTIEGEDDIPTPPVNPVSKLGDIWILGNHRLMCGDSTDADTVAALMNGQKADMVFTDPPYGLDYSGGRTQVVSKKTYGKIKNDALSGDDLGNLISKVFSFNKPFADVYICVSPIIQKPFLDAIESGGRIVDAVIVWNKKVPGLGYMAYRRQTEFVLFVKGKEFKKGDPSDVDLWEIGRDAGTEYVHGTQKPVALSERAITNSSKIDQIVLDLFGGSGSTLIACEKTNRHCRMMELDPKYCDVIIKRWQEYTGKKSVRESDGAYFDNLTENDTLAQ